MEINWFTVIAQIVNFLILVWLLKRFLYKPVLKAIDDREQKVAAKLKDAEIKNAEAEKDKVLFRQKNEAFDQERSAKMNEVHEQINAEKERLFEDVRQQSTALRSKFEESFKQRQQEIIDGLKRKTKDEVFAIAGKTLQDLANTNLEDQVIQVFLKKIDSLDELKTSQFRDALNESEAPIVIKSVFDLSANSKQQLEKAIQKIAAKQIDFTYKLESELLSGIEVDTASFKLSWNIESYLDAFNTDSLIKA